MRTIPNASPYQISAAMRITRAEAADMHADTSGSTYQRDVLGEIVTYDTAARTLTTHAVVEHTGQHVQGCVSCYAHTDDSTAMRASRAEYRVTLTVNGQAVTFYVDADGATQATDYYHRRPVDGPYVVMAPRGFGGYESGRVHMVSTRTIANMVERRIQAQGWFA